MRLWKISGTGMYFSNFYVEADSHRQAYARAQDILHSGYRTRQDKNGARFATSSQRGKNIEEYITSVAEAETPVDIVVLIV
jgi:hypothetical protein